MRANGKWIGWFVAEAPEPKFRIVMQIDLRKGPVPLPPQWKESVQEAHVISALAIDAPDCITARIEGENIIAMGAGTAAMATITIDGKPKGEWFAHRWERFTRRQYKTNAAFWKSAHGKA